MGLSCGLILRPIVLSSFSAAKDKCLPQIGHYSISGHLNWNVHHFQPSKSIIYPKYQLNPLSTYNYSSGESGGRYGGFNGRME